MYYDITAKGNKNKKTYTIRKYIDGELLAKYRTPRMSREEFNSARDWMEYDWQDFLKNNQVQIIKK